MVLLLGGWKFWLCDPIVTCSSKLEGMGSGNCFKNAYLLENSAEITFPFPFTACICLRESLQHLYSTQITSPTLLFALHVSGASYLFTHNLRLMTFLYDEASRGFVLATRISLSDNIIPLSKLCQTFPLLIQNDERWRVSFTIAFPILFSTSLTLLLARWVKS